MTTAWMFSLAMVSAMYCTFMCPPRGGMKSVPPTMLAGNRSYSET